MVCSLEQLSAKLHRPGHEGLELLQEVAVFWGDVRIANKLDSTPSGAHMAHRVAITYETCPPDSWRRVATSCLLTSRAEAAQHC